MLVENINLDAGYFGQDTMTGAAEDLFFTADDATHGPELWRSDGTGPGTYLVRDIDPGSTGSSPSHLTRVARRVLFAADDGVHGRELWRSEGTAAGTVLVKDVNLGGRFSLAPHGRPNRRRGTLRVGVTTEGAGRLTVGPAQGSLIEISHVHLRAAGSTGVTLRPTARGMRMLQRALRQAHREGKEVGKLHVTPRFTFTPCGGTGTSQTHKYVLRLK